MKKFFVYVRKRKKTHMKCLIVRATPCARNDGLQIIMWTKANLFIYFTFGVHFHYMVNKIKFQWNSYKGFLWKKCTKSFQILRGKTLKLPY
jgi:hypothetical protein